jgi:hypothetical protein
MYFTYSGHGIDAKTGCPSLDDIGVQLFRVCRYAGATQMFYPVGLHSMLVADIACLTHPRLELEALLHDGSEAVIGDIPSPVKTNDMRAIEKVIMTRIWDSLCLPSTTQQDHDRVKLADRKALMAEAYLVAPPGLIEDYGAVYDPVVVKILNGYLNKYTVSDMVEPRGKAVRDFLERVYTCLDKRKNPHIHTGFVIQVDPFESPTTLGHETADINADRFAS